MKDLGIYTEKGIREFILLGRPFRSALTAFLLLKEGEIEVSYNLTNYKLSGKTAMVINPTEIVEIKSISEDAVLMLIAVKPEFSSLNALKIKRYKISHFLSTPIKHHYLLNTHEFEDIWHIAGMLNQRVSQVKLNNLEKEIIHHLFLNFVYLFAEVSGKYTKLQPKEISRADEITVEFIKLISSGYSGENDIAYFANKLCITPKYLSESLKASTGYNAREILNLALATRAKILLSDSKLTIKSIAEELNFCDQYAFSKFFKRITSISPKQYRLSL